MSIFDGLANLKVVAHKSESYAPRTYLNASSADLTVAFAADFTTKGELCTKKAAKDNIFSIDLLQPLVPQAVSLLHTMRDKKVSSINVAGNGIYTLVKSGIDQHECNRRVAAVLIGVARHIPLSKIVSGGQTGVDLSGGVVGVMLGVETVMTLPAGFKQRHTDGVDRNHSEAEIRDQVISGIEKLTGQTRPDQPAPAAPDLFAGFL